MISYAVNSRTAGLYPKHRKRGFSKNRLIFSISHTPYVLVLVLTRLYEDVWMEENHTALHCTQSVVLSLSAAAEYHGKHQPFWNKFLSPLKPQSKPLAAHKFACLSVTPGYPGVSPSVGFLTLPSCPPGSVLFILPLAYILQKQIFKYSKAKLGSASI